LRLITAIIPTLANAEREESLFRAIHSLSQSISDTSLLRILVVINGQKFSERIIDKLKQQKIEHLFIEIGSLPLAILEGVKQVDTDLYCFLDDDDEYLPHALDLRLTKINKDKAALVVSNGYRRINKQDNLIMNNINQVENSPMDSLFKENWLASCGGLYRTTDIGQHYFEKPQPYLEWTWLAYQIALANKKVSVIDTPTFIVNDTPGSLSKSEDYILAHISLFKRMLQKKPEKIIKKIIKKRLTDTWHTTSDYYLKNNKWRKALKYHFKSISSIYGTKYLTFSRKFLMKKFI